MSVSKRVPVGLFGRDFGQVGWARFILFGALPGGAIRFLRLNIKSYAAKGSTVVQRHESYLPFSVFQD